jgi:hypothetical protein
MKKLLSFIVVVVSLKTAAQSTIVIQPHFSHGIENGLIWVDSTNSFCGPSHPFYGYIDTCLSRILEMDAIAWTATSCPDFQRTILRFDELKDSSLIPHGTMISSAKLILYGEPSSATGNWGNSYFAGTPYPSTNEAWVHELADTFNHLTVTPRNRPGVKHTDSVAIPASYSRWNETDTIDVTSLVADMVAHTNTGFLIGLQTESYYRSRLWAGCYHPDSTLHPKLIVTRLTTRVTDNNFRNEDVSIFPSPVMDKLNVRIFAVNSSDITIHILNVAGARISELHEHCEQGNNLFSIQAGNYPAGMYLLQVSDRYNSFTQKFVKQ